MKFKLLLPELIKMSGESGKISIDFELGNDADLKIREHLNKRYDLLFCNGQSKGYVQCFHNDDVVENLKNIILKNNDVIEVITSMSGG